MRWGPIGGKPAGQPENQFRPFCSERCRLLDLANWVDGNYRVPAEGERPSAEDLGQHDNSQEEE
jgi:endogenous inhibitor of DNA gyrase (YacG/DUF329 family)